ncbi:heme exporter protein CcmB [Taibaiella koreensis]|uniref:heme exporter protein CcmB n=1 Tax=Taibaiella koreensis TaxID=1268548 RepID=UPI000E59B8A2|nr:heme exporter protein CcmB [Taibaiella koreensis]
MYLKQILTLIRKDFLLEWRQKHTFFGVILYVGCTVFVLYMMAGRPESRIWNALFWVAQLFVTVNTVAKSFLQEGEARMRYYFTLVAPVQYILAKMVYSLVLMIAMMFISLLLFHLLLGSPVIRAGTFIGVASLGAGSLSLLFTFLSAIAAQARQNAALMAILGFPIAIPLLMVLSNLALGAVASVQQESWWSMVWVMLGLDVLILGLAAVLFPFLWKE